jgi:hypothetical protein
MTAFETHTEITLILAMEEKRNRQGGWRADSGRVLVAARPFRFVNKIGGCQQLFSMTIGALTGLRGLPNIY